MELQSFINTYLEHSISIFKNHIVNDEDGFFFKANRILEWQPFFKQLL